jgi:flagellar motor switch protein FliN
MPDPKANNPASEASVAAAGPKSLDAQNAVAEAAAAPSSKLATVAGELAAAATARLGSQRSGSEPAAPPAVEFDLSQLPIHTRSLLRVRVPVTVVLATQRTAVREILELGPGSLIKFDKTYDQPLELTVGDLHIARGEAVKVGDKFGLRIGRLISTHERFASVRT